MNRREGASVDSVVATTELERRPTRAPRYEAENRALVELARHLAVSPDDILQKLVETSLELCEAHSAGISLIEEEDGRRIFRWSAIAGMFEKNLGGTTPRDFSPCGVVLDTNAPQLFSRPARHYPYLEAASPPIVEALLQPFSVADRPIGTLWVMANDEQRKFDAEDLRVLGNLATFAAGAYQVVSALQSTREVDKRKAEFLALLSHEMRSPLSAVVTWSSVLVSDAAGPAARERAGRAIQRNAQAQVRMLDDLLDSSRIAAGKLSIRPEAMDLADAVRDAAETVRFQATERGVALVVTTGSESVPIFADPTRMQQVVTNLLSNAVKFTPANGRVTIDVTRQGQLGEVVVRDTGEGIAPDVLPFIFDRFRQGDPSTTRRHGGLGLGLTISRHLLDAQGGMIEAESEGPGRGATFRVRMPLAASSGMPFSLPLDEAPPLPALRRFGSSGSRDTPSDHERSKRA